MFEGLPPPETLSGYRDLAGEAVDELMDDGFVIVERPAIACACIVSPYGEIVGFTAELDTVHDDDLGRWMGSLSAWIAFGLSLQGVAEHIRLTAGVRKRRRWTAVARAAQLAGVTKPTDRKLIGDSDTEVIALDDIEEKAHARHRLIERRVAGLTQLYQSVSREVGRRSVNTGQRKKGDGTA